MTAYGDELEDVSSNPTTATQHFQDVVARRVSRRGVLQGAGLTALAFLAPTLVGPRAAAAAAAGTGAGAAARPAAAEPRALLGFAAVPPSTSSTAVTVAPGYTARPFLPWGTPLLPGAPAFAPGRSTPEGQAAQVGMHHDGMHYFPLEGSDRGLLVINHEYTDEQLLHRGDKKTARPGPAEITAQQVATSQAAHGVTVAEVERRQDGTWSLRSSRLNRRITARTPMRLSGPAAGHRLLRTEDDATGHRVLGTVNNCSHGHTPWGTYLVAEENFNGYFRVPTTSTGSADLSGFPADEQALLRRYGVTGDRYYWAEHDRRFDLRPGASHEVNRFGWIVELDPSDPTSVPVKRTALGRTKHEGAFVHVTKGQRAVVYTGDDQAGDYVYKFVSAGGWKSLRARGLDPLDEGTLYVARFDDDGSGTWLPLLHGTRSTASGRTGLVAERGFADQGEVLVKTRLAADELGATPMDRPEWTTVDPRSGMVYLSLTNNSGRTQTNGPNPRLANRKGQIVRWTEEGGDHAATRFTWDLFLLAGDGRETGDGSTIAAEDAFGSPDGLWADPDSRLWIQTDGSQPGGANNQMLAANPFVVDAAGAPEVRRFFTGVRGSEVTGVVTTPDQRAMFVNIQHPGDGVADSTWPDVDGHTVPRSSTVVITKDDGGVIGT